MAKRIIIIKRRMFIALWETGTPAIIITKITTAKMSRTIANIDIMLVFVRD
jgi:hypothetical protein